MKSPLKKRVLATPDAHLGPPQTRWRQWLMVGLAVFSLLPSLSQAAVLYVDGEVASSGDGTSWSEAFKTIQEAVDASTIFDELWVKQGTYVLSSQIEVDQVVGMAVLMVQRPKGVKETGKRMSLRWMETMRSGFFTSRKMPL